MLRRYTVEAFFEKVDLARTVVPDIGLSTDIIVAFPGETRDEFEETLEVMRRIRFDDAFTYRFSLREGTPATRFPPTDFISDEEGQKRLQRLIEVHRGIQAEINEAEVGRLETVLVEKEARGPGQVLGRTRRNKVVAFAGSPELVGTYQQVRLTHTTGATFVGELSTAPALMGSA